MATAAPTVWWRRPTPVQQLSVVACRVVVQKTKPSSDQFAVRQRPSPPSLASGPRRPSPSSNCKAVSWTRRADGRSATGDHVLVHDCGCQKGSGQKEGWAPNFQLQAKTACHWRRLCSFHKFFIIRGTRKGVSQLEVPRFWVLGGESGRDRRKITRAPKHSANAVGVVVPEFLQQH